MKHVLVFWFSLLAFGFHALAGLDTAILKTNQVILPSWLSKPSEKNTHDALVAIQAFLEKRSSTNDWQALEVKKILQHATEYRVQFKATTRGLRKVIRCNFFPASESLLEEIWKKEEVKVMDGGFWFWQIEFDPSTGECLNFSSNGYA
jgi:hypothetical protein